MGVKAVFHLRRVSQGSKQRCKRAYYDQLKIKSQSRKKRHKHKRI